MGFVFSLPCSTVLWHTLDDNLIGVSVGSRIFSVAGCPYLLDAKSPDAGAVFLHVPCVFEGRELIDQKTLAKMAGVSRQTVARWEELGFISRSDIGLSGNKYFVIKEVVSQLERLKNVK